MNKEPGLDRSLRPKSKTPTRPFGFLAIPEGQSAEAEAVIPVSELSQPSITTGEQVAAQVRAVSQVPAQQVSAQSAQPEKPANYPQYLKALAFAKILSQGEDVEAWMNQYMTLDEEGIIRLNRQFNSIENLQAPIQLPDKLYIAGNLSVWPSQHEIRIGGKMFIRGNLILLSDANIVFTEVEEFYVGSDVCYSQKTPETTVKLLKYLDKMGRIQGNLEQK